MEKVKVANNTYFLIAPWSYPEYKMKLVFRHLEEMHLLLQMHSKYFWHAFKPKCLLIQM